MCGAVFAADRVMPLGRWQEPRGTTNANATAGRYQTPVACGRLVHVDQEVAGLAGSCSADSSDELSEVSVCPAGN